MKKLCCGLSLVFSIMLGALFVGSSDVFAEAVTTNSFGLLYGDSGGNWSLQRGIYYGFGNGITFNTDMYGRIQEYDWLTPVLSLQGNTASIHFETNIVASFFGNLPNSSVYNPWTNLEYLTVKSCGSRSINTQSVSTAVTMWMDNYDGRVRYNYTLTVYGDVSVSGFTSGNTDDVRCTVSAGDTYFFNIHNTGTGISNNLRVWFEQNPMNFYWSNTIDNSLLQTQVNQNNTIINQNQQMIDNSVNQYNAQKQEETQREQDGNADASQMSGVFNFSVPFILQPLFAGFTDGNSCVSIPTLASWLHSDETQFCPFFPASVRTVLTPIFSVAGSLLLFGFVMRWLGGGSGEVIGAGTIDDRSNKSSKSFWRIGGEIH